MLNDVYNQAILTYAANLTHLGQLENYSGKGSASSRVCGSHIEVTLRIEDNIIVEFAHEVKACALGQASAAIMAEKIIGKSVEQLVQLRADMYAFLKEKAPAPSSPFEAFSCLEPIRDYKNRHASTLLTFDAVVEAIEEAKIHET